MENRNKILIVLIILMLGVLLVFAYLIYQDKKNITQKPEITTEKKNEIQKAEKNYPEDLTGNVYLTLRNKGSVNAGTYYFDLNRGELKEIYAPQDCYVVGGGMNTNGNRMAVSSDCESGISGSSQIYSNNIGEELQVITKSLTGFKKEAVWSPNDKSIAFAVASPDEKDNPNPALVIDTWNIFVSDLEGNEQFVGGGSHPLFSPDGKKILVLRTNGLFLYNLETKKGRRVHIFPTLATASIHLGLSSQKDQLAVSDPHNQFITVFKIKSWDNFELEEVQRIATTGSYASWPKFSPDNQKYLITQEVFTNDNDDKLSIKLVAYNLETKERHHIVDLSKYDDTSMWINDWR